MQFSAIVVFFKLGLQYSFAVWLNSELYY